MNANEIFLFCDPRDIRIGQGRIIWGKETQIRDARTGEAVHCIAGWVLPGGRRTTSRAEARAVAREINNLCQRNYDRKFEDYFKAWNRRL